MALRQTLANRQWLPDPRCTQLNPAWLTQWDAPALALQTTRLYLMPEFSVYSLTSVYPTPAGSFGAGLTHTGWNAYSANRFYVAYGRQVSPALSVGSGFQLEQQRIAGLSRSVTWAGILGCNLQLNQQFSGQFMLSGNQTVLARSATSPVNWKWGAGLDCRFSEQSIFSFSVWQEPNQQPLVTGTFYYQFNQVAAAWLGLETATRQWYAGAGWQKHSMRLSFSVSRHQPLGWSPEIQVLFSGKIKKAKHA